MTVTGKQLPQKKNSSIYSRLKAWSISPIGSTFWACTVLLLVTIVSTYRLRPYTSDDVIWQNALLSWRPFHHPIYYGDGTASYIAKVPLYWLLLHFFSPGRRTLLAEGMIFSIGNFVLIYWASIYFLKKWGIKLTRISLLPFVWLASFGYALTQLFLSTNMHNIEVGVIFAILAVASKIYSGEVLPLKNWLHRILSLVGCLFVGTMLVDDQYLFYFCIFPLILMIIYLWLKRMSSRTLLAQLSALIILSAIFYKAIRILLSVASIKLTAGTAQAQFVNINSLISSFTNTTHGLFIIFGADFWDRIIGSFTTLVTLVNAILLVCVMVYVVKTIRSKDATSINRIEPAFFSFIFVLVFGIYTFSNLSINISTYRYLVLLPFISALLLAVYLAGLKKSSQRILAIILIVAIVFNVISSIAGIKYQGLVAEPFNDGNPNNANALNLRIIYILNAYNLHKGYSGYWDANINSYLSDGSINLLPTICNANDTYKFDWLLNANQYKKPASKTFYLYDPGQQAAHFTCSIHEMLKQFGRTTEILQVPYTRDVIYVYNYDIGTKLRVPQP
jgi:hypothetical protein